LDVFPSRFDLASASPEKLNYHATESGLFLTTSGGSNRRLTNFHALIVEDIAVDDGVDVNRQFVIEARWHGRLSRMRIPAAAFAALGWVVEGLGAGAIIYPGPSAKDHVRTGIQAMSRDVNETRSYVHTGWRKHEGGWVYLHADGAVGANGTVSRISVDLPTDLGGFALPPPPVGEELKAAIRSSLAILDLLPDRIGFPLHGAVARAALGGCDFGIHLEGSTGVGKSETVALFQQHYGPRLDARHLPGSWTSTDNALEESAFLLKDALFVVDDFAPTGAPKGDARLHSVADRLFRSAGNRAGRRRMRPDARLRPARPPRSLILSTGEDVPRGQSLAARLLVLELCPGELRWGPLADAQADAGDGRYASACAGYLQWVARGYAGLQSRLRLEATALQRCAATIGTHKRTPRIVAELALGIALFLAFAEDAAAITTEEADAYWRRGWSALVEAAVAQDAYQTGRDPAERFIQLLSEVLSSGRAHLKGLSGEAPTNPASWGWERSSRRDLAGWRPRGTEIGWIDGEDLYLQPNAAYAAVQELARETGETLPTRTVLNKRLNERGYLASTESKRGKLQIRKQLDGERRSVLHFSRSTFSSAVGAQTAHAAPRAQQADGQEPSPGPLPSRPQMKRPNELALKIGLEQGDGPQGPLGPLPEANVLDLRRTDSARCLDEELAQLIADGTLLETDLGNFVVDEVVAPGIALGHRETGKGNPCRYPSHAPTAWRAAGGHLRCGVCHPDVRTFEGEASKRKAA
jgi:hypothetical protein